MSPDDPRHGTYPGYKAHGPGKSACEPCRRAAADYQRTRSYDEVLGRTRLVPAQGFRRRVEALQAIGWRHADIAREMGVHKQTVSRSAHKAERVGFALHQSLAAIYERLCMTIPDDPFAGRRRTIARSKGYVPPLAWDDIDRDTAPMTTATDTRLVDEVKVRRVLEGIRQDCTPPERFLVLEQWQGTYEELRRITGWNVHRMLNSVGKAA